MRRLIAPVALALVAFFILLAPALLNRGPLYWHDSLAYLHGGSSALNVTVGLTTRYAVMERAVLPAANGAADTTDSNPPNAENDYRITMARSPYYSLLLTSISAAGGPMAPVVLQALLVLASGVFLLRVVFADRRTRPALYLLVATALTGVGLFCSILLPDILAPLGIVATAVLFAFYARLGWGDTLFWFGVLVLSVISHTSHLAVALLLIPIGMGLAAVLRRGHVLGPALICVAAVVIGIGSLQAFSRTVEAVYGYKPRPLPMIAASIIVDGTGLAFLRATCPDNGYVYCDRLDIKATTIDQYLWFTDPAVGVYLFEDAETRNLMTDQQFDFLIDTLRYDFRAQFAASWRRFTDQLVSNSVAHLTYSDPLRTELAADLPASDRAMALDSAAYRGTLPLGAIGMLAQAMCYAALIALAAVLLTGRGISGAADPRAAPVAALAVFTVLVLCGIVANAGITGIVSNPQGRYGARVLWLVPVLLALWLARAQRRHGGG